MRILYLTQWWEPEPNIVKGVEFVRALEAAGHEVTVVTGFPNYPTGKVYAGYKLRPIQHESRSGIRIVRLALYPNHSQSSIGRAVNFLSFFLSALVYGLLRAGRYDLVYVYHPPITVGLAAALFGWARNRKFVIEIQDLWPDMIAASGMAGTGRLARILGPVCNFVYRRASRVIAQSEGMFTRLVERGVPPAKLATIRNPADSTALERPLPMPRDTLRLSDGFVFLYGGNLGAAQGLDTAIRAAKLAMDRGAGFELRLMGRGIEAQPLKELATEIGANNVSFGEPVAKEEVPAVFASADVLLTQWADKPLFQITIPSKTQFYLASGKPILAALDGETADILRASGAAVVVAPGDAEALANAMIEMAGYSRGKLDAMGASGENFYARNFSFETMTEATLKVIDAATGDR